VRGSLGCWSALALAVGVAGACSDFEADDESTTQPDAAVVDATAAETGVDASAAPDSSATPDASKPTCAWDDPFGTPVPVVELNGPASSEEGSARLTPDEKTVYFHRRTANALDIFVAHKAPGAVQFGTPEPVTVLNSPTDDAHPTISSDGLTIAFARYSALTEYDLFVATRQSINDDFLEPIPRGGLNNSLQNWSPFLTADGALLLFTWPTDPEPLRFAPLAASVFPSTDGGTPIERIGAHQTDSFPVLTADQLTMYFSSRRPGSSEDDIYVAHRATAMSAFSAAKIVPNVNDDATFTADHPTWISPDNCRLYIDSRRSGYQLDIFVATRVPQVDAGT
jgi:Tol biopolymer transport system component